MKLNLMNYFYIYIDLYIDPISTAVTSIQWLNINFFFVLYDTKVINNLQLKGPFA